MSSRNTARAAKQPQVFLSYGRRDASRVADEVTEYLTDQGFLVWRDRPTIRPGVPFLEQIEAAIHASDVVVALLSPHSVRRTGEADELDSVCLDELSLARFSKPARHIVPAMVVSCDPPMVIYRQDYVDLTQPRERARGLERLHQGIAEALEGRIKFRAWVDSLRPLDFAPFLSEKHKGFTGREWLHSKVDAWLSEDRAEPALLVKGDPGAGKSAFVASIVEHNHSSLLGYHCCQADAVETLRPGRFVRSLAAMIASRVPECASRLSGLLEETLDEASCEADPSTAFDDGVLSPLKDIGPPAPNTTAFFVVDALDEALLYRGRENRPTIFNVLTDRLARFPSWLRIVATSRRTPEVLRKLRGLRHEELDVHSDGNVKDVEAYVRSRSATAALRGVLRDVPERLERLVSKMRTAGNFLFVAQMLNELERPGASFEDLERLPSRLFGLYEINLERTFSGNEGREQLATSRKLLSVVLAAQEPLSEIELAFATGLSADDELAPLLTLLAPYLPPRSDEQGTERFVVYHKSFADWLQDPELRGTKWYVSQRNGHELLGALFLREHARGVARISDYFLAHGVFHLGLCGQHERIHEVVLDATFVRRVFARLGPIALLQIVDRAAAVVEPGARQQAMLALASAVPLSLPAIAQEPTELEVQLEARLRGVEVLAGFREQLRASFSPDVLVPTTQPLTPALSSLLLSLKTGFAVRAVCVDEAGNRLVSGDEQGQLRVWWLDSGAPILTADLGFSFSCGAMDSERGRAAFGTDHGAIVQLDLETGEVRQGEDRELGSVNDLAIDPSRGKLLSCHRRVFPDDREEAVLACSAWPSLELQWQRVFSAETLNSVRWSTDGSAIFAAGSSRLLRTTALGLDPVTVREAPFEPPDEFGNRTPESYSALAIRKDGAMAVGLGNGRIEMLGPAGDLVRTLPGHPVAFYSTNVSALEFTDGELVSAGWDDAIRVWNVETGEEARSVRGRSKIFASKVFDNGRKAFSGHQMLSANVWSLQGAGHVEGEGHPAQSLRVSEALGVAVARVGRHRVTIWDIGTLAPRHLDLDDEVQSVALDDQRAEVVILTEKAVLAVDLKLRDATARVLTALDFNYVSKACSAATGAVLAIATDGEVLVWRRDRPLSRVALRKDVPVVFAMALTERWLALATPNQIRFHDLQSPRTRPITARLEEEPMTAAFSPDGSILAVATETGRIHGFNPSKGERIWSHPSHDEWLHELTVTASGLICTTSVDTLAAYDVASGKRVVHLHSENGWAECWMRADAQTMLATDNEGHLHVLSRSKSPDRLTT